MAIPAPSDDVTKKFQDKMAEIELKRREARAREQALVLGIPYVHLLGRAIPAETLSIIPVETAKALAIIPFALEGSSILVASAQDPRGPAHRELTQELKEHRSLTVQWHFMSQNSFDRTIGLYATLPKFTPPSQGVQLTPHDIESWKDLASIKAIAQKLTGLPLTEMVNLIIAGAINTKSSDIHIEAEEKGIKLRYRIDGMLTDITELPHDLWTQLASRIKLLSKLKLNIVKHPQDGRFSIELPKTMGGTVDVRVSTLPTKFGESVVIRLLGSSLSGEITFDAIGLTGKAFEDLKREAGRPNGMIITTGPTGSGKTTTMYAIVKLLNGPDVKIITIEDPIEYELNGVNQSQVDPAAEYTFANGLKSIVRQDPDIILVGEIRDAETADIAIQAALTGHLVLSTVHTNSAAGTIPRLLALGAKPFLVAPAMNAMIGQRLVRKLCGGCKQPIQLPDTLHERVRSILAAISPASGVKTDLERMVFFRAAGCLECHDTGYSGRVGIFEIMLMNKEMEKLIHSGNAPEAEIQELATNQGMITMVQDGLLKALEGITSVEEVFRVAEE